MCVDVTVDYVNTGIFLIMLQNGSKRSQLNLFCLQLSTDDITLNADVYSDSPEHSGHYEQLKVCFAPHIPIIMLNLYATWV